MAIKTEQVTINGKAFIRTYSDAGRYVVGGSPEGVYADAVDPADANRTYTEGDLMPDEIDEATAYRIITGEEA